VRIEIHLRDTNCQGKRLGGKKCVLESCRVYREAGDGVRLNNLAVLAAKWFQGAALLFINDDAEKASKTGTLGTEEAVEQRLAQYEVMK